MPNDDFNYPDSVKGVCQRVLTNLNDDKHGRVGSFWSEDYIKALTRDALNVFACLDLGLFTETVTLELGYDEKGVYKFPEDECEAMVEVINVTLDDGRTVPANTDVKYDVIRRTAMFPSPCPHCTGGKMGLVPQFSLATDPSNKQNFTLSPKILPNTTIKVCVTCTAVNKYAKDEDAELPSAFKKLIPALHQWVMYTALATKEPGSTDLAMMHKQTFFDLLPYTMLAFQQAFQQGRNGQGAA